MDLEAAHGAAAAPGKVSSSLGLFDAVARKI
jgi:hypothetical protein